MIPNGPRQFHWTRCQCLTTHRQCFENDFKMDLQRISVPLKNIANVSKRNGNAFSRHFQCVENALQRKNASTPFSLSLVFPNRVTYFPYICIQNKLVLAIISFQSLPGHLIAHFTWFEVCDLCSNGRTHHLQQSLPR